MTIDRPMALLYSMISGRNPIVIMVVPKPSALCTQDPARITIMTNRIVKSILVSSLLQFDCIVDIPCKYTTKNRTVLTSVKRQSTAGSLSGRLF